MIWPLSAVCKNVSVKIFGMECIFGVKWTIQQFRPWILETIVCFGAHRCMFASHMPITLLACSFRELYCAYLDIVSGCSVSEEQQLFHDTVARPTLNKYRLAGTPHRQPVSNEFPADNAPVAIF